MNTIADSIIVRSKMIAYREIYLELLKDERIPYDFCLKVKEKIKALESILFVDEFLEMPPLDLENIELK